MLRKLFSRLSGDSQAENDTGEPEIAARETYKDFEIQAVPIKEGSSWRVAGAVVAASGEGEKEDFVRADTSVSHDDAVAMSLRKARQIVDEREVLGKRTR